jgi:hypothetical protein
MISGFRKAVEAIMLPRLLPRTVLQHSSGTQASAFSSKW